MKVRDDVCYNVNYTLLGKKMFLGIKAYNSFLKIDGKHIQEVQNFVDKYKNEEIIQESLDDSQKRICKGLMLHGFLDDGTSPKESFNEFKKVGKLFFQVHPKSSGISPFRNLTLAMIVQFLLIATVILFITFNQVHIPEHIDYVHMEIWEIAVTILIFPGLILLLHEMGHCIMAFIMGVKISSVSIGWFSIFPVVLVSYYGLNLETMKQKITVMFGGIYMNIVLAALGIAVKIIEPGLEHSAVVDIWISANIGSAWSNLSLFGMTDGYFMLTSAVGIYDIRMKGYKYIGKVLNKRKDLKMNNTYRLCAILLFVMYISGLINSFVLVRYICELFDLSDILLNIILTINLSILSFQFFGRIKKNCL